MDCNRKIELIADILEVEPEELTEESVLEDFDAWDSIAVLGVIAIITENTGKYPHASEILKYKTVKDIMDALDQ